MASAYPPPPAAPASSSSLRQKHVEQLAKTEMCKFFLQSNCGKGAACAFAHSLTEIRQKPNLSRTSMCREFLQSGNCQDPGCRFAHSEAQLRTTETFFKTKVCRFAARGRCKHGQACRFAHTSTELNMIDEEASQIIPDDVGDAEELDSVQRQQNSPAWAMNGSEPGGGGSGGSGSDSNSGANEFSQGISSNPGTSQAGNSEQSTRADSTAQVSTPEGSGDSGQEENMLSHFLNQLPRRQRNQNDDGRRTVRNTETSSGRHCTTMMLQNVPNFLTQGALVSLLEDLTKCMRGTFDFFYCPWDPYQDRNLGYAIVNFFSRTVAADFERQWSNKHLLAGCRGSKRLRIMPAALQGRANNIRHFSGFSLAHHADPRFRPLIRAGPGEPLRPMAVSPDLVQDYAPGQADTSQNCPPMESLILGDGNAPHLSMAQNMPAANPAAARTFDDFDAYQPAGLLMSQPPNHDPGQPFDKFFSANRAGMMPSDPRAFAASFMTQGGCAPYMASVAPPQNEAVYSD